MSHDFSTRGGSGDGASTAGLSQQEPLTVLWNEGLIILINLNQQWVIWKSPSLFVGWPILTWEAPGNLGALLWVGRVWGSEGTRQGCDVAQSTLWSCHVLQWNWSLQCNSGGTPGQYTYFHFLELFLFILKFIIQPNLSHVSVFKVLVMYYIMLRTVWARVRIKTYKIIGQIASIGQL